MFKSFNLQPHELSVLQELSDKFSMESLTLQEIDTDEGLASLKKNIEFLIKEMGKSKTAQLRVQYVSMVNITKNFICAERTGDWDLHLSYVRNILPYFHACGRHLYAKCTHLFLQDMLTLDDHTREIISKIFAVRQTRKFWCGIWSDMTIEKTFMRSMKSIGGLVHGWSMTEDVTNQWILSMPASMKIHNYVKRMKTMPIYEHLPAQSSMLTRAQLATQEMKEILTCCMSGLKNKTHSH